ncbi:MAG: metal-dependent transcriptional regulator [Elusimicrobia bacterium]|nr:metal-dependent transcriptional regulator [Candidatus Obscuribacterium magneticum]
MTLKPMTPLPSAQEEIQEEALADLHECFEDGVRKRDQVLPILESKVKPGAIDLLEKKNLVSDRQGELFFTPEGEALARGVVRRKRLAERLLKDILNVDDESVDAVACQWEHTLSKEVTNSICTLLGHPSRSPFERPIPPGDCCQRNDQSAAAVIYSLDKLDRGERAKIVYLHLRDNPPLQRLLSMGLIPGSTVEILQRFPTYVVQCGESQMAFDEGIAAAIFVHPI